MAPSKPLLPPYYDAGNGLERVPPSGNFLIFDIPRVAPPPRRCKVVVRDAQTLAHPSEKVLKNFRPRRTVIGSQAHFLSGA